MRLSTILRQESFAIGVTLQDKTAALREVARLAKKSPVLQDMDEQAIFKALQKREKLISTGLGKGIALPHCKLDGAEDFVVGVITVPEGVDFDAMDGKPVSLIVFIIAPTEKSDEHIRLLSLISQTLHQSGTVEKIVEEQVPEKIREAFLSHEEVVVKTDHSNKSLVHVFVQDEDLFEDILPIFAGVTSSSVLVVESQNQSAYLSQIPIFAGFWNDKLKGFSRIIMVVVERRMTNEIIRRMEEITGELDRCDRVLLTIQDLSYTVGSLRL